MELGATVCMPGGAPDCADCPLAERCRSRDGLWRELPVKAAKKARRQERLTVFLLRCGDRWALRRRPEKGLLAELWEWPNVPGDLEPQAALDQAEAWGCAPYALERERRRNHIFTHVEWDMRCYDLACREMPEGFIWVSAGALAESYGLPTAFRQFWEEEQP